MTRPPNILFLMADQLAPHFLPAYGHPVVKTPRLDEIAADSAIFDAHYSNSPLCVPARAGLLTGRLPSEIDVFDSGCDYSFSVPTFAHYLRANGYVTVQSGKAHYVGADQLHGLEKRLTTDICPADNCWYGIWDDPDRQLDWFHNLKNIVSAGIAERATQQDHDDDAAHTAVRWLYDYARGADRRPFFLKVSFTHPHDPYVTPPGCWDRFRHDDIDMPLTPFIPPEERDRHGQWLYRHYDRGEFEVTREDIRRRWPLEELTRRILRKQRRNALVHKALMSGEITPLDFQPFDDASKRYYRGHGNWHDSEARDFLRFDR